MPALLILLAGAGAAWWIAGLGFDAAAEIETSRDGVLGPEDPAGSTEPIETDRPPTPPFSVLFAGDLDGREWIPTCSVERDGGLLRIAGGVHEFAEGVPDGMLVVTGNLPAGRGEAGAIEYRSTLRLLTETGLGVIGVGEKDLLIGLERWREIKNRATEAVGIVCANLQDAEGRPLVPGHAYLPIRREGVHRVVCVAILSPSHLRRLHAAGIDVRLTDPAEAVRATLAEAGEHDFTILLSNAPVEESRALFEELDEVDLVISGGSTDGLPSLDPETDDERVFLVAGSGFRYLGRAIFGLGGGPTPRLLDYSTRNISRAIVPSPFHAEHLRALLRELSADGVLEGSLAEAAAGSSAADGVYAGAASCAGCHAAAHASWSLELDPHFSAMEPVRKVGFERVPQCLACHTTAPGRPGGHLAPGDAQASVSCEACHGPGAAHGDANGTVELRDPWASCADCHTLEMSPVFDPAKAWEKVRHE